MDKHEQDFSNLMDELNLMIVDRSLPLEMCRRIRGFFLSTKGAQRQLKQQELLRLMSPALQGDVAMKLNSVWLKKVGLIREFVVRAELDDSDAGGVGLAGPFKDFVVQISMALTVCLYAQ